MVSTLNKVKRNIYNCDSKKKETKMQKPYSLITNEDYSGQQTYSIPCSAVVMLERITHTEFKIHLSSGAYVSMNFESKEKCNRAWDEMNKTLADWQYWVNR